MATVGGTLTRPQLKVCRHDFPKMNILNGSDEHYRGVGYVRLGRLGDKQGATPSPQGMEWTSTSHAGLLWLSECSTTLHGM